MKKLAVFLAVVICAVIAFSAFERYSENPGISFSELLAGETEPPSEITDIGSPYKFYYSQLDDSEKRAYNAILTRIYSMPESFDIPRIDSMQLDDVFWALLCDNPDMIFLGRRCTLITGVLGTECTIEYCMEKEEYEACREKLDTVRDSVISGLTNPEDEWQTELEIHDFIVNGCEYFISEGDLSTSSAYGALVKGAAACEGYSKAAKLLLDAAGIESTVLSGVSTDSDGNEGAHMWNAVKIDGEYYYLDCTWDDPVSDDGMSVRIYSYFNIDNETIKKTHSEFSHDFNCTATAANYYIKTGRYFETYSRSEEKKLASIIAEELESGGSAVEVRFGSEEAYKTAVEELIVNGRIYSVLSQTKKKTDVGISMKSLSYYNDPVLLTLTVIPECN